MSPCWLFLHVCLMVRLFVGELDLAENLEVCDGVVPKAVACCWPGCRRTSSR